MQFQISSLAFIKNLPQHSSPGTNLTIEHPDMILKAKIGLWKKLTNSRIKKKILKAILKLKINPTRDKNEIL